MPVHRNKSYACGTGPGSEYQARATAARRERQRNAVHAAYGGACVCCGERNSAFLTVDHIAQDGAEHRRHDGRCPHTLDFDPEQAQKAYETHKHTHATTNRKATPAKVRAIRLLLEDGFSGRDIARHFDIDQATVSRINNHPRRYKKLYLVREGGQ